jgi:hypothetical protein
VINFVTRSGGGPHIRCDQDRKRSGMARSPEVDEEGALTVRAKKLQELARVRAVISQGVAPETEALPWY